MVLVVWICVSGTNFGPINLEEYVGIKVEGVDVVFLGPADLAASMSLIGQPGHPDVVKAIDNCFRKINESGKVAGILTSSKQLIADYSDKGAQMLGVGLDTILLANTTKELAEFYMPELKKRKSNTQY